MFYFVENPSLFQKIENLNFLKEEFSKEKIRNKFFFAHDKEYLVNDKTNNLLLVIMRILSGNLSIKYKKSSEEEVIIKTSNSLSKLFLMDNSVHYEDELENVEEDLEKIQEDLSDFIEEFYKNNQDLLELEYDTNKIFYSNMLINLVNYYHQSYRESHFAAFVFLYRMYEFISFILPLVFTHYSDDYSETYKQLKAIFDDNVGTELSFFKSFISKVYLKKDQSLSCDELGDLEAYCYEIQLGTDLDQEFSTFWNNFISSQKKKNQKVIRYLLPRNVDDVFEISSKEKDVLKINVLDVHDLFVELRNKTCHYKINHNDSMNFKNCTFDELFEKLNPMFLNWVARILNFVVLSSVNRRVDLF